MNNDTARNTNESHPDKTGFDQYYKTKGSGLEGITDPLKYISAFEARCQPFYKGGRLKGYAQGQAIQQLLSRCEALGIKPEDATVVDTGYGRGALSIYLACKGFNVIGVDISETAKDRATEFARQLHLGDRCQFLAENLEHTSIQDGSVDFIFGFGALHHFIKYPGVPAEFRRIMKSGAEAFFVDAFGENRLFHVFHDKESMEKLGDVILNRKLVYDYFPEFEVTITPTDWFTMLDKLWLKVLPRSSGVGLGNFRSCILCLTVVSRSVLRYRFFCLVSCLPG